MSVLTREALDAWLDRWRARGVPHVDAWQPGLADSELVAGDGVPLPPELRTWWGWRDGTRAVERDGASVTVWMTPGFIAWPLDVALARTAALRERLSRLEDELTRPVETWLTTQRWIELAGGTASVVALLDPTADGRTEVRAVSIDDIIDPPRPGAPSLGTLVQWWIDAIDSELFCWDDEDEVWHSTTMPPADQLATGLV